MPVVFYVIAKGVQKYGAPPRVGQGWKGEREDECVEACC